MRQQGENNFHEPNNNYLQLLKSVLLSCMYTYIQIFIIYIHIMYCTMYIHVQQDSIKRSLFSYTYMYMYMY